jgi:hypothetical protein
LAAGTDPHGEGHVDACVSRSIRNPSRDVQHDVDLADLEGERREPLQVGVDRGDERISLRVEKRIRAHRMQRGTATGLEIEPAAEEDACGRQWMATISKRCVWYRWSPEVNAPPAHLFAGT